MPTRNGSQTPRRAAATEALLLSGIGGCVDGIGVLTLGGLFVVHMSGNSASLGAAFGQGDWRMGWPHLFAVPLFLIGLFLGYMWILRDPTYRVVSSYSLPKRPSWRSFYPCLPSADFPNGTRSPTFSLRGLR